jgi:hypothetical protein
MSTTHTAQGATTLIQPHPTSRAHTSGKELDKETYRKIIDTYFRAFEAHDFSNVQFSPQVQFLPPISRLALQGREEVESFIKPVSTRVLAVRVIGINVDFPTASGLWQITTTKGAQYTVHNFFRLDGDGLLYIWPIIDPLAVMNDPVGIYRWLTGNGY